MQIEKAEVEHRFKRCIDTYDENAHAQKAIIQRLTALLKTYGPLKPARILEVGCGTGLLTTRLREEYPDSDLFINDLVAAMCSKTAERCHLSPEQSIIGDVEQITLTGCFDLIVSASTFQWLTHPARTFARLARQLCKGGRMVFSTFGEDNYKELKAITGNGLVYHSIPEMKALLSVDFEVLYAEENHYILEFENPLDILKHIKKTGVNAVQMPQNWTRGRLEKFIQEYADRFLSEGQYPLTYHPQYYICKQKGEMTI